MVPQLLSPVAVAASLCRRASSKGETSSTNLGVDSIFGRVPASGIKKFLTLAVAVSLAASVASFAADEAAITAKEKAAWQAFKDKKPDEFKKILGGSDLVAVYADGIMNMQNELDAMTKGELKSFALSDIKVTSPDADTANHHL